MKARRKWAIGVTVALVVTALALYLERAAIGMRLFERAVQANVGADRAADLPDGLHAYLCGSGSPLPDVERAGPCISVLAGKQAFVFDVGSGSVRKLLRMGFAPDRLEAVFLTHLHSDHLDGLGELLLQAWIGGGRTTPLPVYGPDGISDVVDGFRLAYARDRDFRIAHHGPKIARPGGFGAVSRMIALPPVPSQSAIVWDSDGVRITAIRVNHAPVEPAFAYRIDYKGRSIAISGDTAYEPRLAVAAKGVDVMFHEALNPKMVAMMGRTLDARGRRDAAQIMRDIPGYHTAPWDAARIAQAARARALVLYHLVPAIPGGPVGEAFLGDARRRYSGKLKIGEDGLLVSLPAKVNSIEFDRLL